MKFGIHGIPCLVICKAFIILEAVTEDNLPLNLLNVKMLKYWQCKTLFKNSSKIQINQEILTKINELAHATLDAGQSGSSCQCQRDFCAEDNAACLNGGTCTTLPTDFQCTCRPGLLQQISQSHRNSEILYFAYNKNIFQK